MIYIIGWLAFSVLFAILWGVFRSMQGPRDE